MDDEIGIPSEKPTPVLVVDKPAGAAKVDAAEVHAWLMSRGYVIDGVMVEPDGTILVLDSRDDAGITAALADYTGNPERKTTLVAIVAAIEAIPAKDRTLAEQAILIMAT